MKNRKKTILLPILAFASLMTALTVSALPSTTDAIIDNRHEASDRAELTDLLPDGKETPDGGTVFDESGSTDGANGSMADESRSMTPTDGGARARSASPAESGTLMQDDASSRTVTGIVLAVIVALAIIVLILILIPKGRRDS